MLKNKIKLSLLSSLLVFLTVSLTAPTVRCAFFAPEGDNNGGGTVKLNVSLTSASNLVPIAELMEGQFLLYFGGPTLATQKL